MTFDNSIDEVDEYDRRRTKSLPNAYDVPRKPTSMIDLYAQSIKITPKDIATYAVSQKSGFHTFPKKNVTRKQSLEHIYDVIPTPIEITDENRVKSDKIDDLSATEEKQKLENHVYQNQQATIENERTKMWKKAQEFLWERKKFDFLYILNFLYKFSENNKYENYVI